MDTINYEQLAQQIKERRESSPELHETSHKEILSSVLHEHRAATQPFDSAQDKQAMRNQSSISDDGLASYASNAPQDAKQKTEELIHYTFQHGLREGIAHAIKADPFVLDLYHDTLTEQLYNELKERKLL